MLLQGHGLPPTHRADVLAETLQSCSDAVLRLSKVRRMHSVLVSAAPVAGDAAAPPQLHKDAALGGALCAAANAAAAAVPGVQNAPAAAAAAADGSLPLKSFSEEELRQLLSAQVVQQLTEFSTAAAAALSLPESSSGLSNE
jgi:enamine deaminase RidA (YjgF/YER057c/UK114 family)